ncbi:MAG TPA: PQQ-dependent sugar dehydrogenase [Verrucomicrobiae bacterium]|nr:PQQ-dependent sugar dehydrogenase [Verrucomicrobiae bacterium]
MHTPVVRSAAAFLARTFLIRLTALMFLPCVIGLRGATTYPPGPQAGKDGTTVWLVDYAHAPFSSRTVGGNYPPPINFNDQLSRINFMRAEPTNAPGFGSRFFVADLNRTLYIVPHADPLSTNTWIRYINFEQVFPRFDNDPGFAGGLATFAFDPEYATNGIFYTVHMETTASTRAPTNGTLPGLNLAGYTTTSLIAPPTGTIGRIAVLIEWRDTNVANTTFEGFAREVLRLGFFGTIHPMGDLLFNPIAGPEDPDYRNLYLAVGDGRAGEAVGTTHPHPQQLTALVGKILRITPDLNLRPEDQLGSNARFRIPTTGADPNPFATESESFTNIAGLRREIFAYGFRNPHRFSWDTVSGKFLVNDIGFNSWEEVNILRKGANYGWAEREGAEQFFVTNGVTGSRRFPPFPFPGTDELSVGGFVNPVTPVYPVAAYSHRDGDAISSGFVYRGMLMPELYGKYIFGDITTARIFYCDLEDMIAADDGDRATMAEIREIQIAWDSPYDSLDQGVTNRRLFDVVAETYRAKGGTNPNALPGGALVTSGWDPDGEPYGGGRADIRLAVGHDNELYVIGKSDATIRKMAAVLGPPSIMSTRAGEAGEITIEWRAFPQRTYRVETTTNLASGEWEKIGDDIVATAATAGASLPADGGAGFFRIRLL